MGATIDRHFRSIPADSADTLTLVTGAFKSAWLVNPQIQKRDVLYVCRMVLLVCCFYKLQGENVTCRGGFIIQHVSRRSSDSYIAATLDGLAQLRGFYSLKTVPLPEGGPCFLVIGNGWHRSPYFEYCANKLQATEAIPQKIVGFFWD